MSSLPSSIRYMSQAKHAEARELMYRGALLFFSHNQVNRINFCTALHFYYLRERQFTGWWVTNTPLTKTFVSLTVLF